MSLLKRKEGQRKKRLTVGISALLKAFSGADDDLSASLHQDLIPLPLIQEAAGGEDGHIGLVGQVSFRTSISIPFFPYGQFLPPWCRVPERRVAVRCGRSSKYG